MKRNWKQVRSSKTRRLCTPAGMSKHLHCIHVYHIFLSNTVQVDSYLFHSVGQPFKGDYLEINKNPKYQKLNSVVDEKVPLADVVNKINRANGKVSFRKSCLKSAIAAQ